MDQRSEGRKAGWTKTETKTEKRRAGMTDCRTDGKTNAKMDVRMDRPDQRKDGGDVVKDREQGRIDRWVLVKLAEPFCRVKSYQPRPTPQHNPPKKRGIRG